MYANTPMAQQPIAIAALGRRPVRSVHISVAVAPNHADEMAETPKSWAFSADPNEPLSNARATPINA